MSRGLLLVEFGILFVALPLGFRFSPVKLPALPMLWAVTAYAAWQLQRDPRFDRARLWNVGQLPGNSGGILAVFVVVAAAIWLGVRRFAPQLQWRLVRRNPGLWAVVMVAYPVLSVYPQGLLYRVFFFERYASLFPGIWTTIFASAAAFAFLHIVFRNSVAVALPFAGGLLFAFRYAHTGSLATSSFEHALYGCWIFTVGLGQFFYAGTIATVKSVTQK